MEIIEGTESQLAEIFANNRFVIIKYHTDNDCPACIMMLPIFTAVSMEEQYKGIKFIRLSSDNNKVAEALINNRKVPFIAVYRDGLLVECDTVNSEEELRDMLSVLMRSTVEA